MQHKQLLGRPSHKTQNAYKYLAVRTELEARIECKNKIQEN